MMLLVRYLLSVLSCLTREVLRRNYLRWVLSKSCQRNTYHLRFQLIGLIDMLMVITRYLKLTIERLDCLRRYLLVTLGVYGTTMMLIGKLLWSIMLTVIVKMKFVRYCKRWQLRVVLRLMKIYRW